MYRALAADVLLLNEIGLDPGIDHCSAISLVEKLRENGKEIVSYTSFCGGLPAPESAENIPLGYKFSWSPRGVLSASLNGAKFKLCGQVYSPPLSFCCLLTQIAPLRIGRFQGRRFYSLDSHMFQCRMFSNWKVSPIEIRCRTQIRTISEKSVI
jgi:Saccharopine dehydrogenase C-terminal domain